MVYDVLNAEHHKKSGILMSTDFQAAFDSVSWDFLNHALEHYNFGAKFRNLAKVMYLNNNNFARIYIYEWFPWRTGLS